MNSFWTDWGSFPDACNKKRENSHTLDRVCGGESKNEDYHRLFKQVKDDRMEEKMQNILPIHHKIFGKANECIGGSLRKAQLAKKCHCWGVGWKGGEMEGKTNNGKRWGIHGFWPPFPLSRQLVSGIKARRGVRNAKGLAKNYLHTYIICRDSGVFDWIFLLQFWQVRREKKQGEASLLA